MKFKKEIHKLHNKCAVNQKANTSSSKSLQHTTTTTTVSDSNDMTGIWDDSRFAHLVSDPRFKSMKKDKKIKIDKRFAGMFKDDKFCVNYAVDKYGRRSGKKSSADDMKKYYSMSSSESDNDEIEQKEEEKRMIDESNSENLVDSGAAEEIPYNLKAKLKDLSVDYARGEGKLFSDDDSSDDDDDSTSDEKDELFVEHCWGELDAEAPRTEESTYRLAACNMDWDRIRASDIMVLCSSFLPPGGSIVSVTIYPSEYGKGRMAKEEIKGPQELTNNLNDIIDNDDYNVSDIDDNEEEEEEGIDFNMEKLRQYQLNRLKYYYAVIECDRVSTADKLYAECDGLEYESTATKLDLRFIPNEMTFDNDDIKDVCTELPDMSKYMPRLFTTTALQQAKVELTWDENDVDRKELNDKLISGKFNEVADQELRKYVAYSSSDESEDDNTNGQIMEKIDETNKIKDPIKKYKALLDDIHAKEEKEKNKRIEMEYSWHIGGGGGAGGKETEIVKSSSEDKNKTHFDKILEYKQQKKKQRKEDKKKKIKLLQKSSNNIVESTDNDDDDDLPDGIDMNDPYFAEEFNNGDFVEPKKKIKKKSMKINSNDDDDNKQKLAELELLMNDDDAGNNSMANGHFSLKKIRSIENESKTQKRKKKLLKKRTKKQNVAENALLHQDDFHINVNDSRFSSIYSSHLYNIDPTNANYKKTNGMEALIKEKLNRRPYNDNDLAISDQHLKLSKNDVTVNLLVKSIKRKIKNS